MNMEIIYGIFKSENSRGENIMIEPSKIKEKFKKIEDENYRFRTYLKIHADPDELDKQFAELHKELLQRKVRNEGI